MAFERSILPFLLGSHKAFTLLKLFFIHTSGLLFSFVVQACPYSLQMTITLCSLMTVILFCSSVTKTANKASDLKTTITLSREKSSFLNLILDPAYEPWAPFYDVAASPGGPGAPA